MALLGIDFGTKNIGVARSDETEAFAFPVATLPNDPRLFLALGRLVTEYAISGMVIGESKDLRWQDNPLMKQIHAFADRVRAELHLPVYLEPEYFTSVQARRENDGVLVDAAAAALILQSYLDKKRHKKQNKP